ncbi:MAG: hypothetical protein ACTHN5_17625 [Phycisphaerae bacterium]
MRLRLRHLLPLLAIAAAARAAAPDDLLDPAPISRDAISINLPKNWKERPNQSPQILLVAGPASPESDTTGDYSPVLIIRSSPHTGPNAPIDGNAQQAHVAGEIPDYRITEKPQQLSLNGLDAVTFGGTFSQNALKLRSRQYFIIANDRLYTLTLITLASTWNQHLPAFDAAIHTFAISPKK